ncbi:hypothetical protein [Arthrobacter sp. HLT1-20]
MGTEIPVPRRFQLVGGVAAPVVIVAVACEARILWLLTVPRHEEPVLPSIMRSAENEDGA